MGKEDTEIIALNTFSNRAGFFDFFVANRVDCPTTLTNELIGFILIQLPQQWI
jgi:hypothetical protein